MNLQQKYNRDDFLEFLKQFLPSFKKDIRPAAASSLQVTKEVFSLGQSADLDLQIFELTHSSSSDARVALAMDGFRMMRDSATYRALVVYHSEKGDDWRLSLMTATPGVNEKGKIGQTLSNPRRFSFFLGPNAKINTPYQLLIKQDSVKDFSDLQKRFSLEVVNKTFYTQIAILFTQLAGGKREVGKKSIDAGDGDLKLPSTNDDTLRKEFTVRLIGRLVFCWFLKKKISDKGLTLLSEDLLSTKAVSANKGYYHSILEPLFFEVLNTPIEKRERKYKSTPWGQTPFLNGGLFNPHHRDYYDPGTMGFSKHINTLKISDDWFKELFEIFETYNFTIDENTSVDVELSIEPEMLGRIFENLLAEINPETGETARKATGSYYTPRPIVEYMVDESLKQCLLAKTGLADEKVSALLTYDDRDAGLSAKEKEAVIEALDTIKIIDPACGSGAFPMGILQKMLLILQKVDPDSQGWLDKKLANIPDAALRRDLKTKLKADNFNYIHKLGIIRDAIYGVDIQPIAVEISKLRFFLSLIVDEKVNDAKDNRGIEPLPNLEFKFVCANSLIGLPKVLAKDKHKGKVMEIASQRTMFDAVVEIDELKSLRDEYLRSFGEEKKKIEKRFQDTQGKMFKHSLGWGGKESQTLKLSQWSPFSEEPCSWFDPDWMFGIRDGFDIVIGNPPYIFSRENLTAEDKAIYKKGYELTQFKINLYILFIEKAYRILNASGAVSYIIPNNWLTLGTNSNLRRFLLTKTSDIRIVLNFDKVFENASVDTCILLFSKNGAAKKISGYQWGLDGVELIKSCDVGRYLNKDGCILGDLTTKFSEGFAICEKINLTAKLLSNYADVKNGVQAYTVGEGVPIQTKTMKEKRVYHSNHRRDASWIKYLDGVDVMRYQLGWSGEYIKYGKNLSRSREPILFQGERLLVRQIPGKPPYCIHACYAVEHTINDNNSMIIKMVDKKIHTKYVLALVNSKLLSFWFVHTFGKLQRKIFPQFKIKELRLFPIIEAEPKTQALIINLVDKIINLLSKTVANAPIKQKEILDCENNIDQTIYKLYGLTKEEIKIVEGEKIIAENSAELISR